MHQVTIQYTLLLYNWFRFELSDEIFFCSSCSLCFASMCLCVHQWWIHNVTPHLCRRLQDAFIFVFCLCNHRVSILCYTYVYILFRLHSIVAFDFEIWHHTDTHTTLARCYIALYMQTVDFWVILIVSSFLIKLPPQNLTKNPHFFIVQCWNERSFTLWFNARKMTSIAVINNIFYRIISNWNCFAKCQYTQATIIHLNVYTIFLFCLWSWHLLTRHQALLSYKHIKNQQNQMTFLFFSLTLSPNYMCCYLFSLTCNIFCSLHIYKVNERKRPHNTLVFR